MRIKIEKSWCRDGYNIWLIDHSNGQTLIAKEIKIEFKPIEEGQMLPSETLFIPRNQASDFFRAFKDGLLESGYFEEKELKPIIAAKDEHIDDLRKVIGHFLNNEVLKWTKKT